jgi:hypothetical protein
MKLQFKKSAALLLAASLLPSIASAQKFAVWLDGDTSAGVATGDGALGSLDNHFGAGHWTLASNANLETPGWLNNFDTLIMSRVDSGFGVTTISATAAANIKAYVGSGAGQGGVALFSNDAKDNWFGSSSGDPYDVNLDRLFVNAATFASATHHGFIGEFNGTFIGLNQLGLLPGVAGTWVSNGGVPFEYIVGPIGAGHPIDNGVTFPFVDNDKTTFLFPITGALPGNIVDVYGPNSGRAAGFPAILANERLIQGGVPEVGSTLAMLLFGLVASLGLKKRLS